MFRPSPSSLKAFSKLFNQQLPLNARESNQLLVLLTSSFRRHLDISHSLGNTIDMNIGDTENLQLRRSTELMKGGLDEMNDQWNRKRQNSLHEGPSNIAAKHLRSVLTYPLFCSPQSTPFGSKKAKNDPMVTFDKAVAAGMMSIDQARACLYMKKEQLQQARTLLIRDGIIPDSSIRDDMRDSAAGFKVLRWLISSGTVRDDSFRNNERFMRILMQFLVAERLQEAAWPWVKTSIQNFPGGLGSDHCTLALYRLTMPLLKLVEAEIYEATNLDAGYLSVCKAAQYLSDMGGLSCRDMRKALRAPVRLLMERTLAGPAGIYQPPSKAAFESFLDLIHFLKLPRKLRDPILAHLYIVHPTNPSATNALKYFHELEQSQCITSIISANQYSMILRLGLDTVKYLLEHSAETYSTEARWVLEFLRTHFLGNQPEQNYLGSKAELTSLEWMEWLDKLCVA